MTIIQLLRRDIKIGIMDEWYKYLYIIVLSFILANNYFINVNKLIVNNSMNGKGELLACIMYILKGDYCYEHDIKNTFTLPIFWMCFQLGIHYIIAYYTEKDFVNNGMQIVIKSHSRVKFFMSKVMWCVLSVLSYYFLMIVTCIIVTVFKEGTINLNFENVITLFMIDTNLKLVSFKELMLILFFVEILATISVCLIQILLSLVISPIMSFAVICCLYIISGYYCKWWLIGNYTMLLRSSYLTNNGLSPYTGISLSMGIIVVCLLIGDIYFNNKSIL